MLSQNQSKHVVGGPGEPSKAIDLGLSTHDYRSSDRREVRFASAGTIPWIGASRGDSADLDYTGWGSWKSTKKGPAHRYSPLIYGVGSFRDSGLFN